MCVNYSSRTPYATRIVALEEFDDFPSARQNQGEHSDVRQTRGVRDIRYRKPPDYQQYAKHPDSLVSRSEMTATYYNG